MAGYGGFDRELKNNFLPTVLELQAKFRPTSDTEMIPLLELSASASAPFISSQPQTSHITNTDKPIHSDVEKPKSGCCCFKW